MLRQKLDSWFSELAPVEEIQTGIPVSLCRMAPLRVHPAYGVSETFLAHC